MNRLEQYLFADPDDRRLGTFFALFAVYLAIRGYAYDDLNPWKLGGFAMYTVPGRWETSVIEVRLRGEADWQPYRKQAPGAPARLIQAKEDVLKNAPFAEDAARAIAAAVRAHRPEVDAVRVRSRVIRRDRATSRFRLGERVYEPQ